MDRQTFSESFKQMVIDQIAQGQISGEEARRRYNIKGHSSIKRWQRNYQMYGKCSLSLISENILLVKTPKPAQAPASSENLQARIKQLERQLEDEQLRCEAYSRMIDIAEQQLKVPIRKKPNTK